MTITGIRFDRREIGPAGDGTFRIDPVAPMEEIRKAALDPSPAEEEGKFREPDLVAEGFSVYQCEWWHFDHGDWCEYPILNEAFEDLANAPGQGADSPESTGSAIIAGR